jgi:diguanylate cyclase (GGDEF)-like protein/PAS domain S-box-containing protein
MINPAARWLPSSLKFRLTSVVIVLVLAATVLLTLFALSLAERDMKGVIGEQQSALLASAAAFIDDRLQARKDQMAALARTLPAALRADPRRLQAFLASHQSGLEEFINLSAFDRDGRLIASMLPPSETPDVAGKAFVEQTVASKQGMISAPFLSRLSGTRVVLVSEPVFDDAGALAFVLTGGVDLQHAAFLRQIDTLKPGKTGYLFIMTTSGMLVDHPAQARLLQYVKRGPGANPATVRALAGFEGWTEGTNTAGSPGIYAYKRLKSTGWIVGARYPNDEAFAPMIEMRQRAVLVASLLAAIAGGLAWLLIHRLLAPLEALRRDVSAIRSKRAGISVLQVRRDDEIGELGRAFYELMAEREAAQERTRDSEKRARIIADSIPALIGYINSEQRYEFSNAHYQDMLGLEPKSMIGRTVRDMLGEPTYAQLQDKLAAALRGERMHFEHTAGKPGHETHYMIDYIPDFADDGRVPGMYVLAMDISERKNAELTQAASEKRLKLITDNLPVLISYIDREHNFRFGNATYEKWFGLAPSSLVGRPLSYVLGNEGYQVAKVHLENAFQGWAVTFERKSTLVGKTRFLETTYIPDVQADGGVAGVYALTHDMTRMKEVEEKLMQLARVDALTGIANRRLFGETLQLAIERARRHRGTLALAYLDIDHFKKINDTYGHGIGDEVLKEFARRLAENLRATDTVARLSGDEFVIILEDLKNDQEAAMVAVKLIDAIRQPFMAGGGPLAVTTSVGIALYGGDGQTDEALLANADSALYAAKRKGRDGYTVHGW